MFVPTIKYKRVSEQGREVSVKNASVRSDDAPSETTAAVAETDAKPLTLQSNNYTQPDPVPLDPATKASIALLEEVSESSADIVKDPDNPSERILITLSDGTQYTADRYCPHAGADLALHATVSEDEYGPEIGPILVCPLHYWEFALEQGGRAAGGLMGIDACRVKKDCKALNW